MAANVEDKADKRPPRTRKQGKERKQTQNAKRVAYRRENSEPIKS